MTKPVYDVKILTSVLAKKSHCFKPGLLFNSLEKVTVRLYPEVKRIKDTFLKLGLSDALMSGSGPAVFSIVSSRNDALRLAKIMKKREKSWRIFAVKTV